QLDLKRTLFLVASKSGTNLEMHALLLYFLAKSKLAGMNSAAANFVAITEEGSYLSNLGRTHRFLEVLEEPHGFRGRYSGVVHYSHLLAGLCKFDIRQILTPVREMRTRCAAMALDRNPAAQLAAFLAAVALHGSRRLLFRASARL